MAETIYKNNDYGYPLEFFFDDKDYFMMRVILPFRTVRVNPPEFLIHDLEIAIEDAIRGGEIEYPDTNMLIRNLKKMEEFQEEIDDFYLVGLNEEMSMVNSAFGSRVFSHFLRERQGENEVAVYRNQSEEEINQAKKDSQLYTELLNYGMLEDEIRVLVNSHEPKKDLCSYNDIQSDSEYVLREGAGGLYLLKKIDGHNECVGWIRQDQDGGRLFWLPIIISQFNDYTCSDLKIIGEFFDYEKAVASLWESRFFAKVKQSDYDEDE